MGIVERLEAAMVAEEWGPAWPDDSSVTPFIGVVRGLQAFVRDAAASADLHVIIEAVPTTSISAELSGETSFIETDW